jgi:hypothetical protein
MIMSIYVTLGIFLLLAVRDPAADRSLIAFGGWANLAHAGVMAAQEYRNVIERQELAGGGCVRNRRYFADRAGSREAFSRAGIRDCCVGSQSSTAPLRTEPEVPTRNLEQVDQECIISGYCHVRSTTPGNRLLA